MLAPEFTDLVLLVVKGIEWLSGFLELLDRLCELRRISVGVPRATKNHCFMKAPATLF